MQEASLRWRAARSAGAWYQTLVKTMGSLRDPELLAKLQLSTNHVGDQPSSTEELGSWTSFQYDVLVCYATYIVELCSAHAWSQVIYAICLPHAFACLHHEGLAQRRACMALIKRIWNAVTAMEQLLLGKGDGDPLPLRRKKFLQECMHDLAWRHGQIAREILIACESAGWNEANEECRLFSYLLFAGCPNTKFYLEDAFGHLSDVASRFARHHKMTKRLVYFISIVMVSYVP